MMPSQKLGNEMPSRAKMRPAKSINELRRVAARMPSGKAISSETTMLEAVSRIVAGRWSRTSRSAGV